MTYEDFTDVLKNVMVLEDIDGFLKDTLRYIAWEYTPGSTLGSVMKLTLERLDSEGWKLVWIKGDPDEPAFLNKELGRFVM